jgi:HlyD family secretion protein
MTKQSNGTGNGMARRHTLRLVGVIVVVAALGATIVWLKVVRGSEDATNGLATFVAKRGSLTISVLEAGAIKAKEQEVIRSDVEGRVAITFLIPEGTYVNKGDVVIELDVSTLRDNRIDQEIKVQNANAAYINAQETLNITKSQAQSDNDKADLVLKFARQDLKQYLEGQYPNDLIAAQNKVNEANEVLTRAEETLKWSQRLFNEKYISETELMADRLAKMKGGNSLTISRNDLRLLEEFAKQRKIDQFTSDVNQAEMALERTIAKGRASTVQTEADLSAKKQEFERQVTKLKKIDDQLTKAKLTAPVSGMVVYATSARGGGFRDDRRPLAEGVEVFERQELIYLPKSASTVAEVDVHEASLQKVHAGLPAIITVDALPGKKFMGTVARIAPLPNPQSMWMNPDLKVYTTNIDLEANDQSLRSGMSCKAEIIVEQYQDVVYIPIQSVLRVGGQPTIYVVEDGEVQERKVEIGLDNNSMVKITSGLSEGELVLLAPPLKAATMEPGAKGPADANDGMTRQISEKLKAANGTKPIVPAGSTAGPQQGPGQPAGPGGEAGPQRLGQRGSQPPSAEQMDQARKRLESMSPEERQQEMEKMKQRFQNMTPEEREQMRQKSRGQGGQGGRRGDGGRQGPRDGQGSGDGQGKGERQGPGQERTQ